jgi:putative FmdB family regulatory protein
MPLYEYECAEDGVFEAQRPLGEFAAPATCPVCDGWSQRILSAPRLTAMPRAAVVARDRNERSAHEPSVVSAADKGGAPQRAKAASGLASSGGRPWALGHG